jgi:hypothetical protein
VGIELGLAGDIGALKICLDRLCPPLKSRPITFKLPPLHTVSDALSAISLIVEAAASGEILANEEEALTGIFVTSAQPHELWGTFAVDDHLRPRAFVAESILFDRLSGSSSRTTAPRQFFGSLATRSSVTNSKCSHPAIVLVATQTMALRRRSPNRLPIGSTPRMAAL